MKKLTISIATLLIAGISYGQVNKCNGLTKDSVQCKNLTTSTTKLCHFHNPDNVKKVETTSVICSGTTKSGRNCKSRTKDLSGKCHHHRND